MGRGLRRNHWRVRVRRRRVTIRLTDLVNEQHNDSASACHATPDAMQPRSTVMSTARGCVKAAPQVMRRTEPSALAAARHASAEVDQSMSKTDTGYEDESRAGVTKVGVHQQHRESDANGAAPLRRLGRSLQLQCASALQHRHHHCLKDQRHCQMPMCL